MKRYRFRLESVLRARRAQEDVARQSLVQANRQVRSAQEDLHAQQQRYGAMQQPGGLLTAAEAVGDHVRRQLMAQVVGEASQRFEDLVVAAAVHQAAWREAAQRVATLERLDERRRAEHALQADRADLTEVDDLVTSRFGGGLANQFEATVPGPREPAAVRQEPWSLGDQLQIGSMVSNLVASADTGGDER